MPDRRQLEALHAWLGQLLDEGADPGLTDAVGAFYDSPAAELPSPSIPSATDLLVPWQPMPAGRPAAADPAFAPAPRPAGPLAGADPLSMGPPRIPEEVWDAYFANGPPAGPIQGPPAGPGSSLPGLSAASAIDPAPAEAYDPSWMVPASADPGAREAAVAVVYDFLHAIERRRLDEAFDAVADDFHAMEGDVELDKSALQARLGEFLDLHGGGELRVFPVQIPRALPHPVGMLVPLEIAVDWTPERLAHDDVGDTEDGSRDDLGGTDGVRSWRFDRVVVLEATLETTPETEAAGAWSITGLGSPGPVAATPASDPIPAGTRPGDPGAAP